MNKFINRIFILVLLCSIGALKIHAQVKTIVFDWKAKTFNGAFPFDEKFQIKIINLPSDVKSPLHLRILKLDDKKISKSLIKDGRAYENVVVDTSYYSKLEGQELTFLFTDTDTASVTSVEFASLKPNQAYVVYGFGTSKRKLTSTEKLKVKDALNHDSKFKEDIYKKISQEDYYTLKPAVLNNIMLMAVHKIDNRYDVDLKVVDSLIYGYVVRIGSRITNVSGILQHLRDTLKIGLGNKVSINRGLQNKIDSIGKQYENGTLDRKNVTSLLNNLETSYVAKIDSTKLDVRKEFLNTTQYIDEQNSTIDNLIDSLRNNILPNSISEETVLTITLNNTIPGTIEAKANIYIAQSAGAGYSIRTDKILSYIGYSFFFRPVNQEISLSAYSKGEYWAVRLCLNVGFSLNDISTNKNGKISGTLGNQAIIIGGGFRILPFLKVDVNNAFYYLNDPNPLINQKHLNMSTIFGLSLNLNIAKLFAGEANPLNNPSTLFK